MNKIEPIEEMTLEGFQIVQSNMFHHPPRKADATCTIWPTRISFNNCAGETTLLRLHQAPSKPKNKMRSCDAGLFTGSGQHSLDKGGTRKIYPKHGIQSFWRAVISAVGSRAGIQLPGGRTVGLCESEGHAVV